MSRRSSSSSRLPLIEPVSGPLQVRWAEDVPGVIDAIMSGYMNEAIIADMLARIRMLAATRPPRTIIFDAAGITGFSPDVRRPAVELLVFLRQSGLPRAFAIGGSPPVRMMALAIAFTARLPVDFVATRADALAELVGRHTAG